MRILSFIAICCLVLACNNASTSENSEPEKSLSDSLLQQVIDGHDIAMPKMFKLERMQKEAQAELDSLKKLAGKVNKDRIVLLDSTVKKLASANAEMHQWMEGFSYDTLKDNEAERINYLNAQLESVTKMKDAVLSSIALADTVLPKK